jgi:hypothetical protein
MEFPMIRSMIVVALVLLGGCGKAQRTSPVEGVVLLDGKPLVGAAIHFVPQGTGRDATGETDKDGHFVMSTFEPKDGVMAGSYKVVVSPPPSAAAAPVNYATAEEAMAATAKQPTKAPANSFPDKYTRPDLTPLTQDVPATGKLKFELTK